MGGGGKKQKSQPITPATAATQTMTSHNLGGEVSEQIAQQASNAKKRGWLWTKMEEEQKNQAPTAGTGI